MKFTELTEKQVKIASSKDLNVIDILQLMNYAKMTFDEAVDELSYEKELDVSEKTFDNVMNDLF